MLHRYIIVLLSLFLIAACAPFNKEREEKDQHHLRIATAIPVLQSMVEALSQGSMIEVVYIPPKRYSMKRLPGWLIRKDSADFPVVDAVVGISSVWPEINIYPYLRSHNIGVIPIDAAEALIPGGERVAIVKSKETTPPYFWLDPANALLMLGIIHRDLVTLVQHTNTDKALITAETNTLKKNYQKLSEFLRTRQIELEQGLLNSNLIQVVVDKKELSALASASLLPIVTLDEALQEPLPSLLITNKKPEHKSLQNLPEHIMLWSIDDFSRQRTGSFTQRWTTTFSQFPQ